MLSIILAAAIASAHAQNALDRYLSILAESALERRATVVSNLTRAQAEQRRDDIRRKILNQIGGFPQTRSALNARITGTFQREGYRVENVIYESLPRYYVTANMYMPSTGTGPFPAVIGVAGHSNNGKASATYQHVWITLARRGYVVLAFDPQGQGERLENLDPETSLPRSGVGTSEHTHNGLQLLLTGSHIARFEAWDGVRAFDYLLTRKEVDPARIAVAGNSGGGTQAAYLSVLEPRLAAIVSSCYMTSWRELWYNPGPQDAEQVFPGFLRDELDFPDFAFAAAPKPFLMETAIRDFFPIAGGRRTRDAIRGFYSLFDASVKAGYFEYDDPHGWSQPRREAAYRFLGQWLKGVEDNAPEAPLVTDPEQLLYATSTGQVQTSIKGETTQSLNRDEAARIYPMRAAKTQGLSRNLVLNRIGFEATSERFHEMRLELPSNGTAPYPAMLALNVTKEDLAAMRNAGYAVASIQFLNTDSKTANRAFLLGKTVLALQLSDVLNAYNSLASNPSVDGRRIRIYGRGNAAVVALHAAYLTPAIQAVALEGMPLSWLAITQAKLHRGILDIVVPGVLKDYDLPDLAAALGTRPLWLVDTRDPAGQPLLAADIQKVYLNATVRYRPEGWDFARIWRGF